MQLKSERQDTILTIRVEGRIDGANAREFEEAVRTSITENDYTVIIDFEKISYISSAGLRAVLLIAKTFAKQNIKFALYSLSDSIKEIFEISGFDQIIAIFESRAKVLASLDHKSITKPPPRV